MIESEAYLSFCHKIWDWKISSNCLLKHTLIDWIDVAYIRQTFYNINTISDLFMNVAGDTILKFLKEIYYLQKYSSITYILNIWFYPFDVSFICTYNPVVL